MTISTNSEIKVYVRRNKTSVVSVGKVGPRGPQGERGDISTLEEIANVNVESLNNNDVLQYNASSQTWVNRTQESIVDGGNF